MERRPAATNNRRLADAYLPVRRTGRLRTAGAGAQLDRCRAREPREHPLFPLRPNRAAAGADRYGGQAAVVRRIRRLGAAGAGGRHLRRKPAVPVAEPALRRRDGAALQPAALLRCGHGTVSDAGSDRAVGRGECVYVRAERADVD